MLDDGVAAFVCRALPYEDLVIELLHFDPDGYRLENPIRDGRAVVETVESLTQDIRLLAGLQRGMHQPGFTHLALSSEERRVINMHRNLERYLDLPEAERISGGEKVPT